MSPTCALHGDGGEGPNISMLSYPSLPTLLIGAGIGGGGSGLNFLRHSCTALSVPLPSDGSSCMTILRSSLLSPLSGMAAAGEGVTAPVSLKPLIPYSIYLPPLVALFSNATKLCPVMALVAPLTPLTGPSPPRPLSGKGRADAFTCRQSGWLPREVVD